MEGCQYGSSQRCDRAPGASTRAVAPKDFQARDGNDGNVDRTACDAQCEAYCVSQGTLCADGKGKVVDGRSEMNDEPIYRFRLAGNIGDANEVSYLCSYRKGVCAALPGT